MLGRAKPPPPMPIRDGPMLGRRTALPLRAGLVLDRPMRTLGVIVGLDLAQKLAAVLVAVHPGR